MSQIWGKKTHKENNKTNAIHTFQQQGALDSEKELNIVGGKMRSSELDPSAQTNFHTFLYSS